MVRDYLLKMMAHFTAWAIPAVSDASLHNQIVHDARNTAQRAQAELERAIRQARRAAPSASIEQRVERQIAEVDEAKDRVLRLVDEQKKKHGDAVSAAFQRRRDR